MSIGSETSKPITLAMRRQTVERCNAHARTSRRAFPMLALDSPREIILDWLITNDPNGVYTDANNRAEGWDPLTLDEAWELLVNVWEEDDGS